MESLIKMDDLRVAPSLGTGPMDESPQKTKPLQIVNTVTYF